MRAIDADKLFAAFEDEDWFYNADRDIAEDLLLAAPVVNQTEQPDPITGLMPCGCGGKAEIVETYDENSWTNIVHVACKKCKIHITHTALYELRGSDALKEDAIAAWNTAMGGQA